MLQLHNCFQSVGCPTSTLNTTSGLTLSSRIPVEQLGFRKFNERTSYDEYNDILKFSTMCPSLRLLGIYGSPPPKSFNDESALSTLSERNVRVRYYGSCLESPVYNLDLQTAQWKRCDGLLCTEKDFNKMESDWKEIRKRDEDGFRQVINGYRKKLRSPSATKGSVMSGNVNEDENIEHREEDIDIMVQLRIPRDRE
ncbi:hypothetical protein HOLleu_44849 [Holothuria leucospilota]|uniref:Uncharacterized protein n=1 Tax=Holothuria leucospilota TaxID=206669 RepID=A0A9Q1B973_HOLLE|nr:hypothetical protein HOLleu_44849 [Holothuria leucospilota]